MYCKLVLKTGATLSELKTDMVGLLTGTITDKANLLSADTAASELVILEAAEWTFVQDLADTATRKHFVLSGTDDGGVQKTLGIILTDAAGTLNYNVWVCGPWDSVNKRPAAIDPTGWALATSYSVASDYQAGGQRNAVFFLIESGSEVNSVFPAGSISGGSQQLLLSSIKGNTQISSHFGTTHLTMLEVYDVPRDMYPELTSLANWPFVLIMAFNRNLGTTTSMNPGPNRGIMASTVACGLCMGTGVGGQLTSLTGALATELSGNPRGMTLLYNSSPFPLALRPQRQGVYIINIPEKENPNGYRLVEPGAAQPYFELNPHIVGNGPQPRKLMSSRVQNANSTGASAAAYLDELVVGGDTYVSPGGNSSYAIGHYKG